VGHNAYGLDMVVDADGGIHVLHMWNHHVYGDQLPVGSPEMGTYHAWRNPETGAWQRQRLASLCIAGFYQTEESLRALLQQGGGLVVRQWQPGEQDWTSAAALYEASQFPVPLGFMDVIKSTSGSNLSTGLALVGDGLLPTENALPRQRIVWSLMVLP